jgi:hypothetical protein
MAFAVRKCQTSKQEAKIREGFSQTLLIRKDSMNNTLRKLLFASFAVLLTLGAASRAFAQSTGSIRGTVNDPSGAAIAKAAVTVTDTGTGLNRDTVTNESGIFVFPDLPIGTYTLKIAAPGFKTENRPDLTLLTGQVMDLPIAMAVGAQTQQITVTSETQQIETSISTVEQSVTQQQMRDLPLNGRNPLQLTTLTAGTVLTTTGTESGQEDNTGLSVNGLRATQNTYTLDGTIYVNRFFDSVPTMPNPDALQEFTIQASNFSADHARPGATLHTLRHRSASRVRMGVLTQYKGQCAQLFLAGDQPESTFQTEPVRRHRRRTDLQEQEGVFLLLGRRFAAALGADTDHHRIPDRGRACRQLFSFLSEGYRTLQPGYKLRLRPDRNRQRQRRLHLQRRHYRRCFCRGRGRECHRHFPALKGGEHAVSGE